MYIVKEVDGVFIPQIKHWIGWYGLSANVNQKWYSNTRQRQFCGQKSLIEARKRIRQDKGIEENVKYHKAE
tara:strand:- start:3 stop:215 length:213 start_codon:yes stop_codon:yes gene_type:complete